MTAAPGRTAAAARRTAGRGAAQGGGRILAADARYAAAARLRRAGVASPALDANVLLGHVLGVDPADVPLWRNAVLSPAQRRAFDAAAARRAQREPVAYVTGRRAFRNLTLQVDRRVLIPRPESELLVEVCLRLLDETASRLVVDVGAGSGALACAMAQERPGLRVCAADVSRPALRAAAANVRRLGLSDRIRLCRADGVRGLDLDGALVLANLPYVPSDLLPDLAPEVSRWEPRLALDGGADGLHVIRRVIAQVGRSRARAAAFECAPDQARRVAALLQSAGFPHPIVHPDLAACPRVVAAARLRMPSPCQGEGSPPLFLGDAPARPEGSHGPAGPRAAGTARPFASGRAPR